MTDRPFITRARPIAPAATQKTGCTVQAANAKIARIPFFDAFLADHATAVAGWGLKESGSRARRIASRQGKSWVLLEDGFLRSVGRHDPPISLVADDIGMYYDASAPSRLEQLIAAGCNDEQARIRAGTVQALWRSHRVSKYNHSPEFEAELPDNYVLVVDQTFGDLSVSCGGGSQQSFDAMLDAALCENPRDTVVVKVHPDVFSHGKRGYFDMRALARHPRIRIVGTDCHAVGLLERARAVYTVTSLMGFEALLWNKPVRCFAMPFYAGWSLTADECPAPSRRQAASMEDLVNAALIQGPRYVNPANGASWTVEQAIEHVAAARAKLDFQAEGTEQASPRQMMLRFLRWAGSVWR